MNINNLAYSTTTWNTNHSHHHSNLGEVDDLINQHNEYISFTCGEDYCNFPSCKEYQIMASDIRDELKTDFPDIYCLIEAQLD